MTDDECLNVTCGENAGCLNTEGTYSCQCKSGFTGDGYSNCTGESRVCWIVCVCAGLFWLGDVVEHKIVHYTTLANYSQKYIPLPLLVEAHHFKAHG